MNSKPLHSTQFFETRFDIAGREEFYVNDFFIPEDFRSNDVGFFILKTIYDLTPTSIQSGQFMIAGNLPNGMENTRDRNALWSKSVGNDNVHFDDSNSGHFKGSFLDPGDNWKNKFIVSECTAECKLD